SRFARDDPRRPRVQSTSDPKRAARKNIADGETGDAAPGDEWPRLRRPPFARRVHSPSRREVNRQAREGRPTNTQGNGLARLTAVLPAWGSTDSVFPGVA